MATATRKQAAATVTTKRMMNRGRHSVTSINVFLRSSIGPKSRKASMAVRYFNVAGCGPVELEDPAILNLIPMLFDRLKKGKAPAIFGDDYPTPDGSCIRDYIDVVDLAKAHVAAINRMAGDKNKQAYEIFNVGTGRGVSVLELVRKFEEVNHLKLNYKIAPRRAGDIIAIWADPTLANTELGWTAERTLDQTLAAAGAWEKHIRGIKN